MQQKIPAVVAGGNLNGLGVVRSLARLGVPVYLMAATRLCPAAWSRECTFVRATNMQGESFIQALLRLAERLKCRPVLILTLDTSVLTVSAQRQRLEPFYHFDLPQAPIVDALSDKLAFAALAAREGLPIPRGCALHSEADLGNLNDLASPMILKPADKGLVILGSVERAVRAQSHEEARALARGMLAHVPAVIAQEWIEGADSDIYFTLFVVDRGTPSAIFTGRKLLSSPPGVGSTAICVAAPDFAEVLGQMTRQFLERVPYQGIGSLEFKRDVRNGRFMIIEPTVGRTDWQEEIATLCGVNLPAIAYQQALGHEFSAHPLRADARSIGWRADCAYRLPAEYRGRLRVSDGYFRWGDPLPAVYYYSYERGAARVWRRLRRALRSITPQPPRVN